MTWTKAMYFPKMLSKYICMYEMQMFSMLSMHQSYVMLWNAMLFKECKCYMLCMKNHGYLVYNEKKAMFKVYACDTRGPPVVGP